MIAVPASGLNRLRATAAGVALIVLAGCSAPVAAPPPLLHEAAGLTRSGEEAYLTGRAGDAVTALGEAARLHLAAGDLPGAARALLNLALAERASGDSVAVAATAGRLRDLTPPAQQQVRERGGKSDTVAELATATAWFDALLAVDRADFSAAGALLAAAETKFSSASPWPGRVETLRAELALHEGRLPEALIHARAGQAFSAAARDRAEEARARRIAGEAHLRLGEWTAARADFLAALRIEETLGGGARMAGDLNHLAEIAGHLGDSTEAQLYTQRANAITAARRP